MDKKIIEEINLKCSFKVKNGVIRDLKGLLKLCDKENLMEKYELIKREETNSNKNDLINKLYTQLTKREVIESFLKNLIKDEYNVLVELVNNNGLLQDNYAEFKNYEYMFSYGIAYSLNYENKVYIVIPDEVVDIIKHIDIYSYEDKVLNNNNIYELAHSMVNLYGAVPFDHFLNSLRKYYGYNDFKNLNMDCIFIPARRKSITNVSTEKNLYIINPIYLDEETSKTIIFRVISLIEDDLFEYDFKEISLDELLKYKDLYYYEKTDSVLNFTKYLESKDISYKNIDLLIGAIVGTFRMNYQEGILFLYDSFEEEGLSINDDNINELLPYINNIINDISIWGNKGWTNKEIILSKHIKR